MEGKRKQKNKFTSMWLSEGQKLSSHRSNTEERLLQVGQWFPGSRQNPVVATEKKTTPRRQNSLKTDKVC